MISRIGRQVTIRGICSANPCNQKRSAAPMPTFAYVVKDKAGKTHSGTLETESRNNLIEQLWKQEFVIISIDERSQGRSQILKLGQPGVKAYQLVVFSRQLATMVDSGMPL